MSNRLRRADSTTLAHRALEQNRVWYHTIELAPDVVTPGHIDLRRVAPSLLPDDLAGRRALDIGTFDGFWAFEFEARGADVVAIDVEHLAAAEWPPLSRTRLERVVREWGMELGRGFGLAADALGSKVQRVVCDVYDLSPEVIGGPVDLAFSGAILIHLRDPVKALERVRGALVPGGTLLLLESFSVRDTLTSPRRPVARFEAASSNFNWWQPNVAAIRAWLTAAGFADVRRTGIYRPTYGVPEMRGPMCGFSASCPP